MTKRVFVKVYGMWVLFFGVFEFILDADLSKNITLQQTIKQWWCEEIDIAKQIVFSSPFNMSDLAFGARYKNILKAVQRDGIDSFFLPHHRLVLSPLNSVFFVFFFFSSSCAILKITRRTTRSNNFVGIAKSSGSYETNQFTLEISFVFFFCSFKFIFQNFVVHISFTFSCCNNSNM
jgi:hypothetical protein